MYNYPISAYDPTQPYQGGSHKVNGIELVPGAPGYDAQLAKPWHAEIAQANAKYGVPGLVGSYNPQQMAGSQFGYANQGNALGGLMSGTQTQWQQQEQPQGGTAQTGGQWGTGNTWKAGLLSTIANKRTGWGW